MRPVIGVRKRHSFGKIPDVQELPNLIEIQTRSFDWLLKEGLGEVLREASPIEDFGQKFKLEFKQHRFGDIKNAVDECKEKGTTYSAPLYSTTQLVNKESGEIKEQEVFMGDFALMTEKGTFVINGTERVIVSQLVRSPGVYFGEEQEKTTDKLLYTARIIPNRGAWLEYEIDKKDIGYARVDRKRKLPITILLRALDIGSDEDILNLFNGNEVIKKTLMLDGTTNSDEALQEIYKRLRPSENITAEGARSLFDQIFFDPMRYDLGKVGRYKVNKKLSREDQGYKHEVDPERSSLTKEDIIESVRYILELQQDAEGFNADDIDHFGNRRIKSIGELIQNQFRIGLTRMEKTAKERMTTLDPQQISASSLINIRPITAAMKEFFGSSQLSQFMDQTNPLTGLSHRRRLSALGPGGLSRERAGFEVRDVHHSHYGRMCPIETPEGPNIGLIGALATYGQINDFGFIETPYLKVVKGKVTKDIEFLTADDEIRFRIAQANAPFDQKTGKYLEDKVLVRRIEKGESKLDLISPDEVDYMDVSPRQIVSVATALIPFLEHDDVNRALMGANMQRQAVPLVRTDAPLVGTGIENRAIRDTGEVLISKAEGTVKYVSAEEIVIERKDKKSDKYKLAKFTRSNQGTCYNQKPIVATGEKVEAGQIIADGPCSDRGELALGKNLMVAFMTWEGYNFEDAIILSERVVKDDVLTSIHISEYECDARDTKLGAEEITRDVPNIGEEASKDLDMFGIVRVGAEVRPGDILVGKVTPKGETELTAEERLLRAIFGEKAREVRDTSMKVPHGEGGRVIDVKVFSRANGDDLPPGVNQEVKVFVAQKRKISIGDKLAGRHGNKGVISRIVPEEDMPYTADGTPIDVILNPLGVPSRMNLGQILETHLGWAAASGWPDAKTRDDDGRVYISTPVFDGATEEEIKGVLKAAGLPESGKTTLYDGKTGERYSHDITVGQIYILKLHHLVDDKIHARSTGPYSLVTQQPLGGKAQFGGQRFGEMEVWALEAYGAANILQEILTVKSDDVSGRVETYEAIVKGENIPQPKTPESFKVLIKEMQSLGLKVDTDAVYDSAPPMDEGVSTAELFSTVADDEIEALVAKALTAEDPDDDDEDESGKPKPKKRASKKSKDDEGIEVSELLEDEIIGADDIVLISDDENGGDE